MNGVPAIVVGIFVFGLLVVGRGQSAVFGAFALAILMLPMVARATQEVLDIVPRSQREASLALGVTKWRTTWSIILPSAIGGILTGVVIAVARVAGETAPLLFTSSIAANAISFDVSSALPTLPVAIFVFADSADPGEQAMGWAAAFVLILFVLVMNVLAKIFAGRKRRQLEGSSSAPYPLTNIDVVDTLIDVDEGSLRPRPRPGRVLHVARRAGDVRRRSGSTAALSKALADPARVRIVNMLATAGEGVCVCELTEPLGFAQPTVSHHLAQAGRGRSAHRHRRRSRRLLARPGRARALPGRHDVRSGMTPTVSDAFLARVLRARQTRAVRSPYHGRGGEDDGPRAATLLRRGVRLRRRLLLIATFLERGESAPRPTSPERMVVKEHPEVLFVCVQNAGRSQMAAGLLTLRSQGRVHVRSAGEHPRRRGQSASA